MKFSMTCMSFKQKKQTYHGREKIPAEAGLSLEDPKNRNSILSHLKKISYFQLVSSSHSIELLSRAASASAIQEASQLWLLKWLGNWEEDR